VTVGVPGSGELVAADRSIAELRKRGHPARVLVLTTFDTDRDVLPAIAAGASGYLLKDARRDELLRAVRAAHAGQPVLAPSVAGALVGRVGGRPPGSLSPRELDVLRLVASGSSNQGAARALLVSEATIKVDVVDLFLVAGVGGVGAHPGQPSGGVAVVPGVGVGEVALDEPGVNRERGPRVDGLARGGQCRPGAGVVGVQVEVVGELPGTPRVAQGVQCDAHRVPWCVGGWVRRRGRGAGRPRRRGRSTPAGRGSRRRMSAQHARSSGPGTAGGWSPAG